MNCTVTTQPTRLLPHLASCVVPGVGVMQPLFLIRQLSSGVLEILYHPPGRSAELSQTPRSRLVNR